ncbi:hypothetical protein [Rufibacter ruber]|uniref:hypothetical protein n=1 Tax=Rufibacter ruber TaxID=1783499 RepID=UPI0008295FC6|nr:hypothetical protein [Rufibacter ruber]
MMEMNTDFRKMRCNCLWLSLLFLLLTPSFGSAQSPDSTVTVAAGKHYLRSGFHRFWWGSHYRKVWAQPVQAPLLWVSTFQGGVKPVKEGGSFQTKNLRLVDSVGHEYVLRSIDKDPSVALPEFLQKTFVARLMRDQTSVIHPYGAFIVPALASAANVYHTNPRLVVIADDAGLGPFRKDFANMLALLEERPDGNWENLNSFGNPSLIVSSRKAFGELLKHPEHQVDARRYLRSRLFDMWLSDWSRREDQWRWGVGGENETVTYAPIPRDRDHAFFKFNDGVLTKLVSLFKKNYQSFDGSIVGSNVAGLIMASKQMDSYLLAYLSEQEFTQEALALQQKLNDQVIAGALQNWPPQIKELTQAEFTKKLKDRRQDLPEAATAFYRQLNRHVKLAGTAERDLFQLEFRPDGSLTVQHWSQPKGGERQLWHQKTFYPAETRSLAIYGLGEEDELKLTGKGKSQMKISWYGGEDTDKISLADSFDLSGKKIQVLDEEDGNEYPAHKRIHYRGYSPKANEFTVEGWLLRHRLH